MRLAVLLGKPMRPTTGRAALAWPRGGGRRVREAHTKGAGAFGPCAPVCRKSGLRHFFEVFIAPLRLRRGQGAMQRNPCYARLFADLPYTPPNPIIASGGQSRAPPVAGGARRKPSEQGSARKAPQADAAQPLRTALRPPNPQGFLDRLSRPPRGRLFPMEKTAVQGKAP